MGFETAKIERAEAELEFAKAGHEPCGSHQTLQQHK
jgi:hypothetical protein